MSEQPRMKMSADCVHAQHRKCVSDECWCACHGGIAMSEQEKTDQEMSRATLQPQLRAGESDPRDDHRGGSKL